VLFIPTSSGHTGLTGASDQSDWCRPMLGFPRVNVWVSSLLSCVAAAFGSFWSSVGLFGVLGLYGSHSLPPLWFAVSVLQLVLEPITGLE
jgi:hypothetical protein